MLIFILERSSLLLSKIDLFKDFYEAYGSGDYTEKKESVLTSTINQVIKEEVK